MAKALEMSLLTCLIWADLASGLLYYSEPLLSSLPLMATITYAAIILDCFTTAVHCLLCGEFQASPQNPGHLQVHHVDWEHEGEELLVSCVFWPPVSYALLSK